jgi:hypothetical protein
MRDVYTGTGLRQRTMDISKNQVKLVEIINECIILLIKNMQKNFPSIVWYNHCTANKLVGMFNLHPFFAYKFNRKKYRSLIKETLASLRIEHRLRLIVFSRMLILLVREHIVDTFSTRLPSHGQRTHANGKSLKDLKKLIVISIFYKNELF